MKPLQQCTLSYTPPGFKQTINIPFPAKGLSVCEKCKKNFKTRALCRHRYGHTDLPTGLTYICINLDSSCINPDGSITDKPLTAQLIPRQPYLLRKESNGSLPICSVCKEKNYTRAYCRNKFSHKMLPWNTNYVVLSANYASKYDDSDFDQSDSHAGKRRHSFHYKNKKDNLGFTNKDAEGKNSIINISNASSRTFLAQVRVDLNKVEWLEHDHSFIWESRKYDDNIHSNDNKGIVPPANYHRSYARSNVIPKFGGNTTCESINSSNDFHSRDNQYTSSYPDEHGVWNKANAKSDHIYSRAWDMRRYNNMPNKDYDYISSYHGGDRYGAESNITSTDYISEHNTKLPTQLHPNHRGNFDNYSHPDNSRIENVHNRSYVPYEELHVDTNWSNMASYHSPWEHHQDRTNSQQFPSNVYSSNQEGPHFLSMQSNDGKITESNSTLRNYGSEQNVKLSSQLQPNSRGIGDNYSHHDNRHVESLQKRACDIYGQFEVDTNISNQPSKYSPREYQQDKLNVQEYSSNIYSGNEDGNPNGYYRDGN